MTTVADKKRSLIPVIALSVLLALPATASAAKAGHNPPTRLLEKGFKTALFHRAAAQDGCYLPPARLASAIREREGLKARVARGLKRVKRSGVVHVVKAGHACHKLRLAARFKGEIWVLNSIKGTVSPKGRKGNRGQDDSVVSNRGPLRGFRMVKKSFRLNRPDDPERFEVRCPKKTFPLGGGMISRPGIEADGAGAYHHSYERLGAQRGWHVNAFVLDPTRVTPLPRRRIAPRKVTVQGICGRGLGPHSAPRSTVFIRSGETKTTVSRCPKGQYLMSGGYQRTDFLSDGGNYAVESRAISARAWRVRGAAHGAYGGELTALAYCTRSKRPLIKKTVKASVPLPAGQSARAVTRKCPKGLRLTFGGFRADSNRVFIGDAHFVRKARWAVSAYGYFGGAHRLTAFGYCLRPGV